MPSLSVAPTQHQQSQKNSSLGFENWLNNFATYIRGEQVFSLPLVQSATTLHIRGRGITIDDMVGYFGITPGVTENRWINYDPSTAGDVHPLNIVGPAIATNKNACLQSNAEVEVSSANQSAEHKHIAQRWQKVSDYFERMTWDESKRGFIFDATQKEGTNLIDTFCKEVDSQGVPEVQEGKTGLAVYKCPKCGPGITQVDEVEAETVECPGCGETVEAVIKPISGLKMDESAVPVYDIEDETIPFFNFTIDTIGAKVGGIKSAGWLQVQKLRDLAWMETQFPGRTFTGPARWSYSLQCAYALARGRWQWLNSSPQESLWASGHERYEVREIYLHEDSYANYKAPSDYEFVDCDGETTFRIKQGQTIAEAQEACYGENQHGFKYLWCEEQLLTIVPPETEELNFRERFSDVHWSREAGAYLSSPNYSIVYVQDDITLLNTLNHNIIARNAVNPIFYDSLTFEQGDFSKEFIGSKNRAFEPDFDIRKSVASLPTPSPVPQLPAQMQWLWEIKDGISQVTPAMRGEAQKGAPYAAQRQQLEQSYGNLTAVLKSFAQCKVQTFRNKAKLAKKRWTLEQFQRVGSMFDEPWTEDDVEQMCAIDFDRDLIVSYREGSEMPSTPMTKELKFFGALTQLGGLLAGIPPEIAVQIISPDKWQQIISQAAEFGGMDFDLANFEVDEVINQKRFSDLANLCEPYAEITYDQLQMMKQETVAVQPPADEDVQMALEAAQQGQESPMPQGTPVTAFDVLTERTMTASGIHFSRWEDMDQSNTFFTERFRIEQGKPQPNEVLLAMMDQLLESIAMFQDNEKKQQMANDPQIIAAAQADQMTQEDQKRRDELEAQRTEAETATAQGQLAFEHRKLDVQATENERADILDVAKHVSDQEQQSEQADKQRVHDAKHKPKESKKQ